MQTGVDDMDPNKGIDLKCQAIEALLRQHPELVGRVVLLQVGKACWVAG
jgi:trehalose-6-phosphate synthase